MANLFEKMCSLGKNMSKLLKLEIVLLERVLVGVDLLQIVFELFERGLEIDHLFGLGRLDELLRLDHDNLLVLVFEYLVLEKAQLALHLLAATHLVDELALKCIHIRVQLYV